jgi:hypothetical protein
MIQLKSTIGALLVAGLFTIGCGDSQPEPSSVPGPELMASGTFVNKGGQETSGTYRLERAGDYRRLLLQNDFQTDDGPDLHVVLSPLPAEDLDSENATANGAAVLDSLSALQGKQVYYLPDTLDLEGYRSVLIHCVDMSHLYGAAPLEPAE